LSDIVVLCVCTAAAGFFEHVLKDTQFKDLNAAQIWAAKNLGWSERTWNDKSFTPTNLLYLQGQSPNQTALTFSVNAQGSLVHNSFMHMMGNPTDYRFKEPNGTNDDTNSVTAHFLATRVLRFTIATYVVRSQTLPLTQTLT